MAGADLGEPPFALLILIAHDAHGGARDRVAVFVENPARDRAAAGQTEIDALQLLAVGKLQRRSVLHRPPLAVRKRDEPALRNGNRITPRRQIVQLVRAVLVGRRRAAARQFDGGCEHSRPLHRFTGVCGDDGARDPAG